MARFLTGLFYLLLLSASTFSQPFDGGFFIGFSASQVEGDSYGGYDKFGLTAGGFLQKDHLRKTNWKAELRYIQKGSAKRATETDPTLYKLTIHYVEFPLLYQYEWKEKITFEAGLAPDVYLTHREEDESGIMNQDDRPAYHRFGLNVDIGIIYHFSDEILIEARHSNSLLPMRDHASGQTYLLNKGQYNNLLHFTVYYYFK